MTIQQFRFPSVIVKMWSRASTSLLFLSAWGLSRGLPGKCSTTRPHPWPSLSSGCRIQG